MKWIKYFEGFQKNKWEVLLSNPDKKIEGERLIDLVDTAYSVTPLGSFVKTINDVIKSQWAVIDYNEEDGIDACIFYRNPRPDENWSGQKIQGIGHDGEKDSKKIVIQKMVDLLEKDGFWTEVSDKMEEVLRINGCRAVKDLETLQKLFPNSKIEMLEEGQYQRTLDSGEFVKETVFGFPIIK